MIRFSLFQTRAQSAAALAALVIAAILAAVTGPQLLHDYNANVVTCQANNDCGTVTAAFEASYRWLQVALPSVMLVLPALIGAFWGAPLIARELESGTFRLAWTQSVTRRHWLAVKLGLAGLASVAVTGLLSLIVTWWFNPLERVQLNRLSPAMFGERGITPIGYAAFAFALGVTAGTLIRRTIPAMATTLVIFTGLRLAVSYWVRPHLIAPLRASSVYIEPTANTAPSAGGTVNSGAWVLSDQIVGAGRVIGQNGNVNFSSTDGHVGISGVGACPNAFPSVSGTRSYAAFRAAAQECIDKLGIKQVVTYQPLSHYWALQWYETLIFTGLAIVLAGVCFWWVRRSLT